MAEDKPIVFCWVCEKTFHGVCVGLSGRVMDAFGRKLGIKWCCSDCRDFDMEALRAIRAARNGFNELQADLNVLINKCSDFQNKFNFLKEAQPLNIDHNKKSTKKRANTLTLPPVSNNNDRIIDEENSPLVFSSPIAIMDSPSGSPITSPVSALKSTTKKTKTTISSSPTSKSNISTSNLNKSPSYAEVASRNNAAVASSLHSSNSPSAHSSSSAQNTNQPAGLLVQAGVNKTNTAVKPSIEPNNLRKVKPLVWVERKKYIFISRLAVDTHADDVKNYISSKLNLDSVASSQISVLKLNSIYKRNISSFKIGVPSLLFDKVLDSSFWPSNAIYHEFEFRIKNDEIGHLDIVGSKPKN